jgi:hypothetical protein
VDVIEKVSADSLLGGRSVFPRSPRSGLEWVDVVRHGISSRALGGCATAESTTCSWTI